MKLPRQAMLDLSEAGERLPGWSCRALRAFTLLEVMIAVAIFFMALFTILEVVSQGLNSARRLQRKGPNAGIIASELSLTNRLEEGMESGEFELYPEYTWERNVMFHASNGLFKVEFAVFRGSAVDSTMTIFLYRPQSSPPGGLRR